MARVGALATVLSLLVWVAPSCSHPLGNFSVGQFALLSPSRDGLQLQYVLDLAEMPTFFLRTEIGVAPDEPIPEALAERYRQSAAVTFLSHLEFILDGAPLAVKMVGGRAHVIPGAGDQPTLRLETAGFAPWPRSHVPQYSLHYEDKNYTDRIGWKDVVVRAGPGVDLIESSAGVEDRSRGLSQYPDNALQSSPQIRSADLRFRLIPPQARHRDPRIAPGSVPLTAPSPNSMGPRVSSVATTESSPAPGSFSAIAICLMLGSVLCGVLFILRRRG